ncbi:MAG: hypothetical protein U0132_16840, partial [Gemmatimonadaceae bacterium]
VYDKRRSRNWTLGCTMNLPVELQDGLKKKGTFSVRVMPSEAWLANRQAQHQALPWHESVLRPLLQAADAAWVYELKGASEIFAVADGILRPERGKYAIDLNADPITGHELLWNASGGKRGSIVIKIPASRFPGAVVFPNCEEAFVISNSTVGESPAAVRFARACVADGQNLCCLLSRSNGFARFSIYTAMPRLEELFVMARSLVVKAEWYRSAT